MNSAASPRLALFEAERDLASLAKRGRSFLHVGATTLPCALGCDRERRLGLFLRDALDHAGIEQLLDELRRVALVIEAELRAALSAGDRGELLAA